MKFQDSIVSCAVAYAQLVHLFKKIFLTTVKAVIAYNDAFWCDKKIFKKLERNIFVLFEISLNLKLPKKTKKRLKVFTSLKLREIFLLYFVAFVFSFKSIFPLSSSFHKGNCKRKKEIVEKSFFFSLEENFEAKLSQYAVARDDGTSLNKIFFVVVASILCIILNK